MNLQGMVIIYFMYMPQVAGSGCDQGLIMVTV